MLLGVYQHYKGKSYEVTGVAKHSETLEELVVYRALYGKYDLWVRPLGMFLAKTTLQRKNCSPKHLSCKCSREEVELEGKRVPRFTHLA